MDFLIWHLLAICSVMAVSFVAGMWYARNKDELEKPASDKIKLYK